MFYFLIFKRIWPSSLIRIFAITLVRISYSLSQLPNFLKLIFSNFVLHIHPPIRIFLLMQDLLDSFFHWTAFKLIKVNLLRVESNNFVIFWTLLKGYTFSNPSIFLRWNKKRLNIRIGNLSFKLVILFNDSFDLSEGLREILKLKCLLLLLFSGRKSFFIIIFINSCSFWWS